MAPNFIAGTLVAVVAVAEFAVFAALTRGITFISVGTDNEKQARAAATSATWRWPSDMHKASDGKAYMKDVVVLGIALVQRLLGDTETDRPLVLLCGACNSVSAVLLYSAVASLWGYTPGLLAAGLFLSSFWPSQVALLGGHICVATTVFLSCVDLLLLAAGQPLTFLALMVLAGWLFGWMLFSSASARKFIAPVMIALFLSARSRFGLLGRFGAQEQYLVLLVLLTAMMLFVLAEIGARFISRRRDDATGLQRLRRTFGLGARLASAVLLAVFGYSLAFGVSALVWQGLPFLVGASAGVALLLLPDVRSTVRGYTFYWRIAAVFGHFGLYRELFAREGHPIAETMRGAGWSWLWRIFLLMAPVETMLLAVSLPLLAWDVWTQPKVALVTIAVTVFAFSPTAWGELTHGPQLSRSYLPGFITQLALPAWALVRAMERGVSPAVAVVIAAVAVGASAILSGRVFFSDVLPSRLAATYLGRALMREGVTRLYTYDTRFNEALADVLAPEVTKSIEIHRIDSLAEIPEEQAWVVVPGSSSKAYTMESQREGMDGCDFNPDPVLNNLLDSRWIERFAVEKFATMGSSRIWVHESEVTSYRDLILHEITAEDRYRSRAWLIRWNAGAPSESCVE